MGVWVRGLAMVALAGSLVGCEKLLARYNMVALMVSQSPNNATGLPGSIGAALPEISPDGATLITASIFEGTSTNSSVVSADVQVNFANTSVPLCDAGGGNYYAVNLAGDACAAAALTYIASESYVMIAEVPDKTLTATMNQAPAAITIADPFTPSFTTGSIGGVPIPTHTANTSLTVDWSNDPAASQYNGIITVYEIVYGGGDPTVASNWTASADPVYDSAPGPSELFDFVAGPVVTNNTIPSDIFIASTLYLINVTAVKESTATSGLRLGSGFLAGEGAAWAVYVP